MKIRNKQTGEIREIAPAEAAGYGLTATKSTAQKIGGAATAIPKFMFPQISKFMGGAAGASVESLKSLLGGDFQGAQQAVKPYRMSPIGPLGSEKSRGAAVEGLSSLALNKLINVAGNKILPKHLKDVKLRSPKGTQQSATAVKKNLWDKVEKLLSQPKGQQKTIKTSKVVSVLDDMLDDFAKTNNISAFNKIEKLSARITTLGENISAEQAILLSKELKAAQKLFGASSGKITATLGQNEAKQAALKLSSELSSQAKGTVPGLGETMGQYGQVANLSRNLTSPFKNWWMGGLAGAMGLGGAAAGMPQMLAPASAITLGAMPYTRFALQKLLQPAMQAGILPAMAGMNQLLNLGQQ